MIARLGALTALLIGLCSAPSARRCAASARSVAMLYFGTVVMAFGVAVMQPALPPLVRTWVPQRIGFATAVYTNGLLIGEILPAALTIPLVLPMLRQSWQWDFVFWAVPVAIIAAIVFGLAPRAPAAAPTAGQPALDAGFPQPADLADRPPARQRQRHLFLDQRLPARLPHPHRAARLINAALTALNLGQLPASFLLLASADRMVRTMWSYRRLRTYVSGLGAGDRVPRRRLGGGRLRAFGAASAPRSWCWFWRCRR